MKNSSISATPMLFYICLCKPVIKETCQCQHSKRVPPHACLFFFPSNVSKLFLYSLHRSSANKESAQAPSWPAYICEYSIISSSCHRFPLKIDASAQTNTFNKSRWYSGTHVFEFRLIKVILWHGSSVYLCVCRARAHRRPNLPLKSALLCLWILHSEHGGRRCEVTILDWFVRSPHQRSLPPLLPFPAGTSAQGHELSCRIPATALLMFN